MKTEIEQTSPLPLYYQLEQVLRQRIARGDFRSDEPMPGELELAHEFGLSRGTVRQAMDRLTRAGLVVRRRGRGSFVAAAPIEYPLGRFYRFAHEMSERGVDESSRVLARERARPPAHVARELSLSPASSAVRVVRLRFASGVPLLHETSWLPEPVASRLLAADLTHGSIYDVLETDGVRVAGVRERVRPVLLGASQARLLQAELGAPAFEVQRLSSGVSGPVEWRSTIAPGDRVTMTAAWGEAGP